MFFDGFFPVVINYFFLDLIVGLKRFTFFFLFYIVLERKTCTCQTSEEPTKNAKKIGINQQNLDRCISNTNILYLMLTFHFQKL